MKESMLEGLMRRLDRLERANRRWKRAAAAVAVGIAAVVLMGQARPAGKMVEAEQFILRDAGGKIHGALRIQPDGGPGLVLFGEDGKPRVVMDVTGTGWPGLYLYGRELKGAAGLAVTAEGGPGLRLLDKDVTAIFKAP